MTTQTKTSQIKRSGTMPPPKKESKSKEDLFQSLNGLDSSLETASGSLEKLKADRSNIVKQIADTYGHGPFEIEGKTMIIANRGETYFFRESTAGKKRGPRAKKNKGIVLGFMRGDRTGDIYVLYPHSEDEYAIQLLEPDEDKWLADAVQFQCTNLEEAEQHLARVVHSREAAPARVSGKQEAAKKPSLEASVVS